MKAINLFNNWVELGKDDGMEKNHTPSVNFMIDLIPEHIISNNFSFLDIGCGNGWLVKKISDLNNCVKSTGIDGAKKMIEKAQSNDDNSEYLQLDLNNIQLFNDKFDIIFSMEVVYYLKNPQQLISHVFNNLLNPGGVFFMGIDYYAENKQSLSWPQDLDLEMFNGSILDWRAMFQKVGFINISTHQVCSQKDWAGTLVVIGTKP